MEMPESAALLKPPHNKADRARSHFAPWQHLGRLWPRGVQGTLVLLVLAVLVPIILLEAGLHYFRLDERRDQEARANLEVARAVAASLDAHIESILRQEQGLAEGIVRAGRSMYEANTMLSHSAEDHPAVTVFSWSDTQGRVVASSRREAIGSTIHDTAYFKDIVSGHPWAMTDLLPPDDEQGFVLAYGLRNAQQGLQGVMVGTVDPRGLDDALRVERVGSGIIAVIDRTGHRVYGQSTDDLSWDRWDETVVSALLAPALAGQESVGTFLFGPGDKEHIAGFAPLRSVGWVAMAGRPLEVVLAPEVADTRNEIGLYLVVILLASLMAVAVARRITGPLRDLQAYALAVGRGEIDRQVAVFGPSELEQLGRAFNRMAKQIKLHEGQREDYIGELQAAEAELRHARGYLEAVLQQRNADLAVSEERFRSVMQTAVDPIIVLDGNNTISFWNDAAERQFGYRAEEIVEQPADRLVPKRFREANRGGLSRLAEHQFESAGRTFELTGLRKDGTEFPAELSIGVAKIAEGDFFTVILRDITGRKLAQAKLEESMAGLLKTLESAIMAMSLTVETRDPYTAGHQRRVAALATEIAKKIGLPTEQVRVVRLASAVHDIGKIAVPAEILAKPGRIGGLERELIQEHPKIGAEILGQIDFPWPIAAIVRQHHERMNGSGYPLGIGRDDILLEARIIAVADVVEAMASHRPYRPALGVEEAVREITMNQGVLYDEAVVAACLAVFAEGEFVWQ